MPIFSLKNAQATLYHTINSQSPHRLLNWRIHLKIFEKSDTPCSRPLPATTGIAHHNSDDRTKTVFQLHAMKIMTKNRLRKGFLGVRLAFWVSREMLKASRLISCRQLNEISSRNKTSDPGHDDQGSLESISTLLKGPSF